MNVVDELMTLQAVDTSRVTMFSPGFKLFRLSTPEIVRGDPVAVVEPVNGWIG